MHAISWFRLWSRWYDYTGLKDKEIDEYLLDVVFDEIDINGDGIL